MNEASQWRFDLARRMAESYAANPKVQAIMVAGSTGRGTADRYSDLEIDIFYSEPPTMEERRAAVARAGATLLLLDEDEDEWEEQMAFGSFHAATSTFLVGTMERYLREVLEGYSVEPNPHMRLHSLLHSQTLLGDALIEGWRARAVQYPDGLVHAMLHEHLRFDGFGYAEETLAARGDLLPLYDLFCRVERQILGALLGLNRLYLSNPAFKGMDETIQEMHLTPPNLATRLKAAFHGAPMDGVHDLHALIEEVFRLVEAEVPTFDTAPYRAKAAFRRGAWGVAPP